MAHRAVLVHASQVVLFPDADAIVLMRDYVDARAGVEGLRDCRRRNKQQAHEGEF